MQIQAQAQQSAGQAWEREVHAIAATQRDRSAQQSIGKLRTLRAAPHLLTRPRFLACAWSGHCSSATWSCK